MDVDHMAMLQHALPWTGRGAAETRKHLSVLEHHSATRRTSATLVTSLGSHPGQSELLDVLG